MADVKSWDGEPEAALEIVEWVTDHHGHATYNCGEKECNGNPFKHYLTVRTPVGELRVQMGGSVSRVKSDFYVIEPRR